MAIIFDLDGTLINSLNAHAYSVKKGIDFVLGDKRVSYSFVRRNIRYPSSFLFKLIQSKLKIRLSKQEEEAILNEKRKAMSETGFRGVRLFSGVNDLFDLLKKEGIKFCIATSMPEKEIPILKTSKGLRILFTVPIFCPDKMEDEKPNPYVLNLAVEELNLDKSTSFYVGDSITDKEAARNAGIGFIGVFNKKLSDSEMFFKNIVALERFIKKNPDKFR